jgi:hypothetical protein
MGDAYVRQLKDLSDALARLNSQTKDIREKQKQTKARFAEWMERKEIEEYQGYKLSKIKPKPRIPIKPKERRKNDAIRLFSEIGVTDPQDLWDRYQQTQRYDIKDDQD